MGKGLGRAVAEVVVATGEHDVEGRKAATSDEKRQVQCSIDWRTGSGDGGA